MSLPIEPLEDRDREILEGFTYSRFLHGECYGFAIALHRALGWKMVGMVQEDKKIVHVALKQPEGKLYFDARGSFDEECIGELYSITTSWTLQEVTEEKLKETCAPSTNENVIAEALHTAFLLWPDLPWLSEENLPVYPVLQFLKELTELSRKYDLWITPRTPTTLPSLREGNEGDEYRLHPHTHTNAYMLDRRTKV